MRTDHPKYLVYWPGLLALAFYELPSSEIFWIHLQGHKGFCDHQSQLGPAGETPERRGPRELIGSNSYLHHVGQGMCLPTTLTLIPDNRFSRNCIIALPCATQCPSDLCRARSSEGSRHTHSGPFLLPRTCWNHLGLLLLLSRHGQGCCRSRVTVEDPGFQVSCPIWLPSPNEGGPELTTFTRTS